jgi:hypothetical protein
VRICLIASSRFPIREPFAGGLESMTWTTARGLAERGHDVTLFAGPGSDTSLPVRLLPLSTVEVSSAAMADKFAPGPGWLAEHHAYLALMLSLFPHPLYAAFYYSHPPTVERVRTLREWAKSPL